MIYLILAALWAAGAVALLVYDWQTDDAGGGLFGGRISSPWVAAIMLLFSLYNVARWWARRADLAERAAQRRAADDRRREGRRREPPGEPDPRFDFTDRKE